MTLTVKNDTITFSSGRTVYAHHLLVGIPVGEDPDGDIEWSREVFCEGYDGSFRANTPATIWGDIEVEDALELCDAMIEAWRRRREFLAALPSPSEASHENP